MQQIVVHVAQGWSWWEVVTPALAMIAAGASWASVYLSRRGLTEAQRPQLVFYIVNSDREDERDRAPVLIRIQNVGSGVALMPGFLVLSGSGLGASHLVPVSLDRGDEARYGLPFMTVDGAFGIVFCEDRANNVHVWSSDRQYKLYKRRQRDKTPITSRRLLQDFKGEMDLDAIELLAATRFS